MRVSFLNILYNNCKIIKFKKTKKRYILQLTKPGIFCILTKSVVTSGILAQLGEHLPYKQRVTGSSPVGPITCESKY